VDEETLQFYRRNAQAYADWAKAPSARLTGFLALLPPGGLILELGCGAGNHSAKMLAAGFGVRPTDGSPEMAAIASRRLGHPVEAMLFDEIDAHEVYDGVWASACLLHVPRDELAVILLKIHRALKPGAFSTPASRSGKAMAGTPSVVTTITHRRNGFRRFTPKRGRGAHSSPTPARSKASTMSLQRCCISPSGRSPPSLRTSPRPRGKANKSNDLENPERQHSLREEADGEGQGAKHRQADGIDDQMRHACPEIHRTGVDRPS
jgi:SAM-dependent methyltransferase